MIPFHVPLSQFSIEKSHRDWLRADVVDCTARGINLETWYMHTWPIFRGLTPLLSDWRHPRWLFPSLLLLAFLREKPVSPFELEHKVFFPVSTGDSDHLVGDGHYVHHKVKFRLCPGRVRKKSPIPPRWHPARAHTTWTIPSVHMLQGAHLSRRIPANPQGVRA